MKLSIISPAFNEEDVLQFFLNRAQKVCESLVDDKSIEDYEILTIDDGSTDNTWQIIIANYQRDFRIKGIKLSRNFGQHMALTAGLDNVSGDLIVLMDSDLQDEPEKIPSMIEKLLDGYDIVYAVRRKRCDSFYKKFVSGAFYKFFSLVSTFELRKDVGIYRILTRQVVENVTDLRECSRMINALTEWVGFRVGFIELERPGRFRGTTKYNLIKMIKLAVEGVTSFSLVPLRIATYFGFIVALFSFFLAIYFVGLKITVGNEFAGWPSLITSILFLGGIQLIALGVIGEYIGKIFMEVKKRPLYIISEKLIK